MASFFNSITATLSRQPAAPATTSHGSIDGSRQSVDAVASTALQTTASGSTPPTERIYEMVTEIRDADEWEVAERGPSETNGRDHARGVTHYTSIMENLEAHVKALPDSKRYEIVMAIRDYTKNKKTLEMEDTQLIRLAYLTFPILTNIETRKLLTKITKAYTENPGLFNRVSEARMMATNAGSRDRVKLTDSLKTPRDMVTVVQALVATGLADALLQSQTVQGYLERCALPIPRA